MAVELRESAGCAPPAKTPSLLSADRNPRNTEIISRTILRALNCIRQDWNLRLNTVIIELENNLIQPLNNERDGNLIAGLESGKSGI